MTYVINILMSLFNNLKIVNQFKPAGLLTLSDE